MTSKNDKFTEVAENSIWRERIKREMTAHQLNDTFTVNPRTLETVTPKIGERGDRFLDRDEALLESLTNTLQRMNSRKTKKKQETSQSEFGSDFGIIGEMDMGKYSFIGISFSLCTGF